MASNAVECVLGKRVKKGARKKKGEKMEKRGKRKTNKDEKRGWHPNTLPSVFSSWLNSKTHEVEVLDTLHPQTLLVLDDKQETSERQRKKTEWLVWL